MKCEADGILGIDFGTTAVGIVVIAPSGALRASTYRLSHRHQ